VDCEQGADVRVGPEVLGLDGAVKVPASLRAGQVDRAATDFVEVRATPVDEGQDRAVIEEDSSVPGATCSLAFNARQLYHESRRDSAANDGDCVVD
tara:strand:- start:44422 stop:44709 length:288 start_codon:yes stop_codon:yes gene_type:complete